MSDITYFNPGKQLTFASVESVHHQFCDLVAKDTNDTICVDLSDVGLCDSAGLALLIEISKLCSVHQKSFQTKGASNTLNALAEFCGVYTFL